MRAALATALALAALAASAAGAAERPAPLVVALDLGGRPYQAGAVRGSRVVLATGFEVEVARAVARRLGYGDVRFVHVPRARLGRPGLRWDLALARLDRSPTPAARLSLPYLRADGAVVLRRGLARPAGLRGLRGLQLCAERRSRGAALVASRVRPALPPLLLADEAELARRVQTGLCDAGVVDAPRLGAFVAGREGRLGPAAGRLDSGVAYRVAVRRSSGLAPRVDAALRRLAADGTLARLRRAALGRDPVRLPVLR